MSENEKDNKDFEFIKEQVIEKKHKKLKKRLLAFCMTVLMAVLFGVIAAVTFCLAAPGLDKFLHKDGNTKTPISFPTEYPNDPNTADNTGVSVTPAPGSTNTTGGEGEDTSQGEQQEQEPAPTPIIQEIKIDADIDDYLSMYSDIRTVVYETNKSLVKVSSIKNVKDLFGKTVDLKIETTGVVIADNNEDLLILVSLDRVQDASSIKVELSDKVSVDAGIQDYESDLNLAVIAVPLENIPENFRNSITVASLGESYMAAVGNPVIALGSPNGHPNSMEIGIITSIGSQISITDNQMDLFNTDIADNDNSDGIIINLKGQIIGLITRTLKEDLNENLNTVIGISKLKSIIQQMANQQPRIYFGVKTEDLTDAAKAEHNVEDGIYVNEVQADSPAFNAGMKNGDIILQVNDTSITNTNLFYNTISAYQPDETVKVKIKRTSSASGKEMELDVTLAAKNK